MIIFRPHRGGLFESLAEAKEFNNVEEMKKYIIELWHENWAGDPKELFTAEDIVIDEESVVNDTRIGWKNSMYVCLKRLGNENYIEKHGCAQCIGMCATDYTKPA